MLHAKTRTAYTQPVLQCEDLNCQPVAAAAALPSGSVYLALPSQIEPAGVRCMSAHKSLLLNTILAAARARQLRAAMLRGYATEDRTGRREGELDRSVSPPQCAPWPVARAAWQERGASPSARACAHGPAARLRPGPLLTAALPSSCLRCGRSCPWMTTRTRSSQAGHGRRRPAPRCDSSPVCARRVCYPTACCTYEAEQGRPLPGAPPWRAAEWGSTSWIYKTALRIVFTVAPVRWLCAHGVSCRLRARRPVRHLRASGC